MYFHVLGSPVPQFWVACELIVIMWRRRMDSGCKLPRELFTISPSPSPSLSHSSPTALQCTANYHQIGGNLTKLYHTHDPTIGVSTLLRSWPADFVRHISHAPPWKAINYVVVVVVVAAARYLLGIYSFLLLTRPRLIWRRWWRWWCMWRQRLGTGNLRWWYTPYLQAIPCPYLSQHIYNILLHFFTSFAVAVAIEHVLLLI